MTPQELKNSILQQAIQGKLVEQCPEEGTAEELLAGISVGDSVDGRRVKQKIISDITDDEKEFDIPNNWTWVKLGTVCTIARGGSPRPIKEYITTDEDGINWIKIGDTDKNGKYISSTAEKIKPSGISKSRMVHAGDFLLTNSMSFGRPYILKVDGCIHDGWLVISQTNEVFYQDFLYWMLSSYYAYIQFCGKVSGAVVKNLNSDKVANSVFPLPPLAEQKRIVAKIEELLPYIHRYEESWLKLEALNSRFPDDMKKSLLQYAIQGKLVEQRPEEGTAEELFEQIQKEKQRLIADGKIKKEKPLPEITEDEKPFDIPESWKWVRLGEIFNVIMGQSPSGTSVSENGNGLEFHQGKIYFGDDYLKVSPQITNEITKIAEAGSILLCVRAPVGVVNIVQRRICIGRGLCALTSSIMDKKFILYFIRSFESDFVKKSTGTTFKAITNDVIKNQLFPLPPLAEQKRIVAKLEQLLPLCDRLK